MYVSVSVYVNTCICMCGFHGVWRRGWSPCKLPGVGLRNWTCLLWKRSKHDEWLGCCSNSTILLASVCCFHSQNSSTSKVVLKGFIYITFSLELAFIHPEPRVGIMTIKNMKCLYPFPLCLYTPISISLCVWVCIHVGFVISRIWHCITCYVSKCKICRMLFLIVMRKLDSELWSLWLQSKHSCFLKISSALIFSWRFLLKF